MTNLVDSVVAVLVSVLHLFLGLTDSTGTVIPPVSQSSDTGTPVEVIRVIDGDTILVRLGEREERVRYIGIDTPETAHAQGEVSECYGEEAKARNEVLVDGQTVTLVSDVEDRDQYGRLLRYVYVEDLFVNLSLIQDGYAEAIAIAPNTLQYEVLNRAEQNAREADVGLWGTCR